LIGLAELSGGAGKKRLSTPGKRRTSDARKKIRELTGYFYLASSLRGRGSWKKALIDMSGKNFRSGKWPTWQETLWNSQDSLVWQKKNRN